MRKMSNAATARLRRSCDWLKVDKAVRRYINEGNDEYSVSCGGFDVRFSLAATLELNSMATAEPPLMSATEKSVRRKLGKVMLNHAENLDDVIYDNLTDREAAWLERSGFAAMSVDDMKAVVNAGMKAMYGIDLLGDD